MSSWSAWRAGRRPRKELSKAVKSESAMELESQPNREPLIQVSDAHLGYGTRIILRGVSLDVNRGDFLGIVGPNGAGKTTILRAVLGILRPLQGNVSCRGRTGYAPQRSQLDPIFPFTVEEVAAMGLWTPDSADLGRRERRQKVAGSLERCGMLDHARTAFRDLSGGQKQRVLVARALVSDPEILILDEPTNDLDLRGEFEVMELVRSLHDSGRTVVMVTHLLHLVTRYVRRLALLHQGRLECGPTEDMLRSDRLEMLYGIPVQVADSKAGRIVAPKMER